MSYGQENDAIQFYDDAIDVIKRVNVPFFKFDGNWEGFTINGRRNKKKVSKPIKESERFCDGSTLVYHRFKSGDTTKLSKIIED